MTPTPDAATLMAQLRDRQISEVAFLRAMRELGYGLVTSIQVMRQVQAERHTEPHETVREGK